MPTDYLFRGDLSELDPDIAELIRHETARQQRKLIMIPSESTIPQAVQEAVGSPFMNIYAEGYPLEATRTMSQQQLLDYHQRLPEYRRLGDNRYYEGTEYANVLESLTRRRAAELFANERVSADQLFVNVQPLSGAPANSAVYTALLKPGDTILSMNLAWGGHLSHGAPANRTGKFFNIVAYGIDPETENLDYEAMMKLALEHQPKIVIGGYSSFPLAPDWHKYREIADAVGAYLLADVAHFAGLIAAGAYPSPVGIADIVTFTTHKTLQGPRGAIILTHRADLSAKLDKGVFPGEQGGPHMNQIAGLAVALRLATTEQFRALQHQTVANARRLAQRLQARGLRVVYKGTDSHMCVVDVRSIKGRDGTALGGVAAAKLLDLVGVVCNFQTIPGDTSALRPSGIRLGLPWITQRGCSEPHIDELADIIADVLTQAIPYTTSAAGKKEFRAKIPFDALQKATVAVRHLVGRIGIDTEVVEDRYPHFYDISDPYPSGWYTFDVRGDKAAEFLHIALTSDVRSLADGAQQPTRLLEPDGRIMATGVVERVASDHFKLHISENTARVAAWLRALSDGYALADLHDVSVTLPGPVDVADCGTSAARQVDEAAVIAPKTYFIGQNGEHFSEYQGIPLPEFTWDEPTDAPLRTTPLTELHRALGAKMAPFAGYEMPLWYDSVTSEHLAVRQRAGVFDVTHMGVFHAQGAHAAEFLHAVTANDVLKLKVGSSHYTFFLDVDGKPLDDLLIYRLGVDEFFIVVNASNNDKNWAWLNAIKEGRVMIDRAYPGRRLPWTDFTLRDLRAEASGAARRVDIALQGPQSLAVLQALGGAEDDLARVQALPWAGITRATLGGFDLIVSRTGYTGERVAYELFPHPDHAVALFQKLIELGATPCGLASRDSLRIEAGLPLYGHELGGELGLTPAEAGMGSYVKLSKPFFIGKSAAQRHEAQRSREVVRFRMSKKPSRPAHQGDRVVDAKGSDIGIVTSCSIDSEGYQLGQALLKDGSRKVGNLIGVFSGSAAGRAKPEPEAAVIISRFPERKS
ncbi:MAG: glycine cleavage system aminomethyltransferase GcvT [Anaerolinea sp.]